MGKFSIHMSVRPYVPFRHFRPQALSLAGWPSGLTGWVSLLVGWIDEWTEILPILQDFVPSQSRCPASPMKTKDFLFKDKS